MTSTSGVWVTLSDVTGLPYKSGTAHVLTEAQSSLLASLYALRHAYPVDGVTVRHLKRRPRPQTLAALERDGLIRVDQGQAWLTRHRQTAVVAAAADRARMRKEARR